MCNTFRDGKYGILTGLGKGPEDNTSVNGLRNVDIDKLDCVMVDLVQEALTTVSCEAEQEFSLRRAHRA